MLNPFAHEFKPVNSFQPQTIEVKQDTAASKNAKSKQSGSQKQQPTRQKKDRPAAMAKEVDSQSSSNSKAPKKKTKADTSSKKAIKDTPGKKADSQQSQASASSSKKPQRSRRKSSQQQTIAAATTSSSTPSTTAADPFAEESKFITIEAAIDPIYRIDVRNKSIASSSSATSTTASDRQQFEHGYERYIRWIDKSLRKFDTVTVVGMDNAVVDVVSLLTIIHDRKIGVHDDIETFSMRTGHNNRIAGCIQAKLHPYY